MNRCRVRETTTEGSAPRPSQDTRERGPLGLGEGPRTTLALTPTPHSYARSECPAIYFPPPTPPASWPLFPFASTACCLHSNRVSPSHSHCCKSVAFIVVVCRFVACLVVVVAAASFGLASPLRFLFVPPAHTHIPTSLPLRLDYIAP